MMRYRSITQHKHDEILIKIISQHKMNSSRKISSSAQNHSRNSFYRAVIITHLHNKPIITPSSSPDIRTGFIHQKPQLQKLSPHDLFNCTKVSGKFPLFRKIILLPTYFIPNLIRIASHSR